MSKKSFFDLEGQGQPPYKKLLQENKIKLRGLRISQAHQALDVLEQDIKSRSEKLQEVLNFLENKQTLYHNLTEQYKHQPSVVLETRLTRLKSAIDDLVAHIEATKPKEVIAEMLSRHKSLTSELARKEERK